MWRQEIKSLFSGKWSELEQRKFAFGFFAGFLLTMSGWGVGWIIVKILKLTGV